MLENMDKVPKDELSAKIRVLLAERASEKIVSKKRLF